MLTKILRMWVHAELSTVWRVLWESVEHPETYVPGLQTFRILERDDSTILREMQIGESHYKEKITASGVSKEIRQELLDHPVYSGTITIKAVPTSVQNPMSPVDLQIFLALEPRFPRIMRPGHESELPEMVTEQQKRWKEAAEELEKQA